MAVLGYFMLYSMFLIAQRAGMQVFTLIKIPGVAGEGPASARLVFSGPRGLVALQDSCDGPDVDAHDTYNVLDLVVISWVCFPPFFKVMIMATIMVMIMVTIMVPWCVFLL